MKVVVITGGIGSGKSIACSFLEEEYGWPVYNADSKVKELYVKSGSLVKNIETALERSFCDENGRFVPSLLASVIFSDRKALETVESMVFPELMADFKNWKSYHNDSDYVILESATILEKPALKDVGDVIVVIDAPVDVRVERASERDSLSADVIFSRVKNQPLMNDISSCRGLDVDYVVLNDSTLDNLYIKLREIAEKLL